jgi:hypothetical protein
MDNQLETSASPLIDLSRAGTLTRTQPSAYSKQIPKPNISGNRENGIRKQKIVAKIEKYASPSMTQVSPQLRQRPCSRYQIYRKDVANQRARNHELHDMICCLCSLKCARANTGAAAAEEIAGRLTKVQSGTSTNAQQLY